MAQYAENTSVPVERSRAEIEGILQRYGADAFRYGWDRSRAVIEFSARDRHIRFVLPLPERDAEQFVYRLNRRHNPPLKIRATHEQQQASWEQACRQRWRALCLAIKAKLEAVDCGISEFEQEFLAHIVDPVSGRTVGELMKPQLEARYEGRDSGQLLLTHKEDAQ